MRRIFALSLVVFFLICGAGLVGCEGGQAASATDNGPFQVNLITTGFSPQIYPYRIKKADANGMPTTEVLNITSNDVLKANLTADNPVLPVGTWPPTAIKPDSNAGNQYLQIRFNNPPEPSSVLSSTQNTTSGLSGSLQVLDYDFSSTNETTSYTSGRAFVGGGTYFSLAGGGVNLKWVQVYEAVDNDNVQFTTAFTNDTDIAAGEKAQVQNGGFPTGFTNAADLIAPESFVFIPDTDDDFSTFECFKSVTNNYLIRVVITGSLIDVNSKSLTTPIAVATTRGPDTVNPEVIGFNRSQQPGGRIEIEPGNGMTGVATDTDIIVSFNKPVQPYDVGDFVSTTNLTPATRNVSVKYTVKGNECKTLYWAEPTSIGDFCNYRVVPAYNLPGNKQISVTVESTLRGLNMLMPSAALSTNFTTGTGAGIINAPVAPEAIYIGVTGPHPGVAVLDLNGYGQGTGKLSESNFTKNPNVGANGVIPALAPGTSNLDAGGAGALTLVMDSSGTNHLLAQPPVVGQVGDIAIGQPLDKIYNNENVNPWATRGNQLNAGLGSTLNGFGNSIEICPHPNPPTFVFPPPNAAQAIFCEPPTATSSFGPSGHPITGGPMAGCISSPISLLNVGDPFGANNGLINANWPGIFYGPQPKPTGSQTPALAFCPYTSRQQIGHFLYIIDRDNRRVQVLNSNRFTVLATIALTDPYSMAFSPNLKMLAVSNFASAKVSFIDVDPASPNFHTVVGETKVGEGPSGLAWQPQGEDLLVTNSVSNSVSVVSGTTLQERKIVSSLVNGPFEISVSGRQTNFGFQTGVYFAYALNKDGTICVFESGPDGVNGIGFDDMIGTAAEGLKNARTMQVDVLSQNSGVWVCHQDDNGFGQISHVELVDSPAGPIPITPMAGGIILPPTFRQRQWKVNAKIGGTDPSTPQKDKLSGNAPSDVCFDDITNLGSFPSPPSIQVSSLVIAPHSAKDTDRLSGGATIPASTPRFIFIANPDVGKIDVFEIDTGIRKRVINLSGVSVLCNYWRQ